MKQNRKASIMIEVDEKGNLAKTHFQGNVGSMFSAVSALVAYLIDTHGLDADDVVNTMKTSILTALVMKDDK